MSEQDVGKVNQKFENYEVQDNDSLRSIAYDHVLPPHSNASVARCMDNILQFNDNTFDVHDKLQLPKPCDPLDGPVLLDRASQSVANTLRIGNDLYTSAYALSDELTGRVDSLSTQNREYNYLVENIHKSLDENPGQNGVQVAAEHWNSATKTWDNLYLADKDYPASPPVRIAQPGNTIGSIADDRMQQLRNQGIEVNSADYIQQFKEANYLKSDSDLHVAMPLKLPY